MARGPSAMSFSHTRTTECNIAKLQTGCTPETRDHGKSKQRSQRSAEVLVVARDAGQAMFECLKSVPA
eukprot:668462-Pleurochrysis_carterae.AAC.2